MYLIYVDDSGDRHRSLYSALIVHHQDWSEVLSLWLSARLGLFDLHEIPVRSELHAVKYLKGRGEVSINPNRNSLMQRTRNSPTGVCADIGNALAGCIAASGVELLTVWSEGNQKEPVYSALVDHLERYLEAKDCHGILMVDGDGSDGSYLRRHRELPIQTRRLVEDPWHQPAHTNQWIQMVDLVAYLAFQSIKAENKALDMIYDSWLATVDVRGGPIQC